MTYIVSLSNAAYISSLKINRKFPLFSMLPLFLDAIGGVFRDINISSSHLDMNVAAYAISLVSSCNSS